MGYQQEITSKLEAAIAGGGHGETDKEEIVWSVIEAVASIIDGATGGSAGAIVSGSASAVYQTITHKDAKSVSATPNPLFVWNGHDGGTKYTRKYLANRNLKGIGGGVIQVVGAAGSGATHVDLGGLAVHGNATGSTLAHMLKLEAIAKGYRQSETIGRWIDVCMKMKTAKAAIRGGQTVGALAGGIASAVIGVGAAASKVGVKLTMTKVVLRTAAELHWRAFQEQAISRQSKAGPASRIAYEIFTRRGATRIFGKYDVDCFIKEPSGWLALSDKLLLI